MKSVFKALLCSLLLAGCAGNPLPDPPPLRLAAENANRIAVAAMHANRWKNAESAWLEALHAYHAIDDWSGQGRARLGLAQTYAKLGQSEQALDVVRNMPAQLLFPARLRARAAYQEALFFLDGHPSLAVEKLDQARLLCGERCDMTSRLDNLEARIAAGSGQWERVQMLASKALAESGEQVTERAHAHRLLAEVALSRKQFIQARNYLALSIKDDRELAEPEWLLEDYILLEQVARESGDTTLEQEARLRQVALCVAIDSMKCTELERRRP